LYQERLVLNYLVCHFGEYGVELRLPRLEPKPLDGKKSGKDRCGWPWTSAYVSYQGLSMPCCMIGTPDRLNLGSMSERPVEEIWNGDLYRDFRDRLESAEPAELCRSCSVYQATF
jgi:radical SAM protein with 4Fe4S-binding SPASM domain